MGLPLGLLLDVSPGSVVVDNIGRSEMGAPGWTGAALLVLLREMNKDTPFLSILERELQVGSSIAEQRIGWRRRPP